jgi:2-polyprenyl-3-methyl-5-hydroxy-6-metoxy-1,4-benzoquinol methylase
MTNIIDTNTNEKHFDKVFSEKGQIEYQLDKNKMGRKDRQIIKLLESHGVKGKNCLDIGPGTGRWLNFLKQMGAARLTGIDLSDQSLKKCKPYCDEIRKINVENEPLGMDSNLFDIVISFEVLEHLFDPTLYLSEISRVMADDAILIMSIPNILSFISRVRSFFGLLPVAIASDPTHVSFYRKKEIKELLRKFNLNPIFAPTSISLNPRNPKSRFSIPSLKLISSLDDSLVFYAHKQI